jgi:hypothetical protein
MRLSGAQSQALVWVAFKDGAKPTRRALAQIVDLGLATAPGRDDPHHRLTTEGGKLLRSLGLARDRPGKRRGVTA